MEKQRGKFSGTAVFNNVVKRRETTIREEAARLRMSEEQFGKMCEQVLGFHNWEKLKKVSKETEKERSRQNDTKEDNMNMEQQEQNIPTALEAEQERSAALARALHMLRGLQEKSSSLNKREEDCMSALGEIQGRIVELESIIKNAKKEKETSAKKALEVSKELFGIRNEIANNQNQLYKVQGKVEELEERKIYVVAPNYHGRIPDGGVAVSTIPIETGRKIRTEQPEMKDVLIYEPTFADFVSSKMEREEYSRAIDFARLCVRYATESKKKVIVLCDDEKWIKFLKLQGIHSVAS